MASARAVPLLKVGRLVMHFAVPLFGHRLHIALMMFRSLLRNFIKLSVSFGPDLPLLFKMDEIWKFGK